MKYFQLLILGLVVASFSSCTRETIVYRKPSQIHVYQTPTYALPGQASKIPDPTTPSNFRAATNQ
jgi:hypothetical protein